MSYFFEALAMPMWVWWLLVGHVVALGSGLFSFSQRISMEKYYPEISITCIAKSVDMRPTFLFVEWFNDAFAAVKPVATEYDRPLVVPRSIIFEGDRELFERLRVEYESGRRGKNIHDLWMKAREWRPV